MAHFIYPTPGKTSFLRDGVTTLPTLDSVTPANDRGLPVVLLAGDALGPVDVNSGAAGTKTLRVVLSSDSTISIEEDKNYGVVGANTIRTAAQIGNATGAADFGSGADSAQTLRVTPSTRSETATTPLAVRMSDGTAFYAGATETTAQAISGKLPATLGQKTLANSLAVAIASDQTAIPASQSGTWNITNITGTVSLPTGAATEVTSLAISGKLPATLGQTTMANSLAVTLASDQSSIPVTQSGTWNINNISGTISLPTGAATEATSLAISGKLPATLGQAAMAASLAVTIASDQSAVPASQSGTWNINNISGTVSLPTGASTEATLLALSNKVANDYGVSTGAVRTASQIGNATGAAAFGSGADSAQTLRVTLSTRAESAATPLAVRQSDGTALYNGASESTLNSANTKLQSIQNSATSIDGKLTSDFGVSTGAVRVASLVGNATGAAAFGVGASSAQTLRVVLADESKVQVGLQSVAVISRSYSTTNVTGTYSNLGSALGAAGNMVAFFETGGSPLIIGWGGVDKFIVPPGGSESPLPVVIPNGTQLQIKTADASTVSSGNFYMTVLG